MGGIGDIILAVILPFSFGITALIMWGEAVWEWRQLKQPPKPHDPATYFYRRLWPWEEGPGSVNHWLIGGPSPDEHRPRVPVQVAEVVAVLGGEYSDSENNTLPVAQLHVRLPDGDVTTIHTEMYRYYTARAGTFLPARPIDGDTTDANGDTWSTAWELSGHEVGQVLLDHRHALGLVDDDAYRVLAQQITCEPVAATAGAIRPTGVLRAGHVEIDLDVTLDHQRHTIRGFLRPEDIATVRHTAVVQVTRTEQGRWLLWPTWY